MDAFEPNWQTVTWGEKYARLLDVKREYDPNGLFWCRHCVGSEEWEEDDKGRLCRPSWWTAKKDGRMSEEAFGGRHDEL